MKLEEQNAIHSQVTFIYSLFQLIVFIMYIYTSWIDEHVHVLKEKSKRWRGDVYKMISWVQFLWLIE